VTLNPTLQAPKFTSDLSRVLHVSTRPCSI